MCAASLPIGQHPPCLHADPRGTRESPFPLVPARASDALTQPSRRSPLWVGLAWWQSRACNRVPLPRPGMSQANSRYCSRCSHASPSSLSAVPPSVLPCSPPWLAAGAIGGSWGHMAMEWPDQELTVKIRPGQPRSAAGQDRRFLRANCPVGTVGRATCPCAAVRRPRQELCTHADSAVMASRELAAQRDR